MSGSSNNEGMTKIEEFFTLTMVVIIPFEIVYQPLYLSWRGRSQRKRSNFVCQQKLEVSTAVEIYIVVFSVMRPCVFVKRWRTFPTKLLPSSSGRFVQNQICKLYRVSEPKARFNNLSAILCWRYNVDCYLNPLKHLLVTICTTRFNI
jgi:hypothetical protein